MKTTKLVLGIISIVLSMVVLLQSCAVSVGEAIIDDGSAGGSVGILVAVVMMIMGIVSVAARNSRGAGVFCMILYAVAGLMGMAGSDSFPDLGLWGGLCLIFALVYLIFTIKTPKAKKNANGAEQPK